jgi:hypothetical protein
MKRILAIAVAILLVSLFAASGASASDVQDVIHMHGAGIADSLIIQKIHYSGKVFHLDAKDLYYLKQAGVSDEIISVMLATEQQKEQPNHGGYYYPPYPYVYPYYAYPYGPYYPSFVVRLGFNYGYGHYGPYPYYGRVYRGYYGYPTSHYGGGYRGYYGGGGGGRHR